MQVVDVDAVLDGVEAELVGLAEGEARLDAAAGQPHREAVDVVVAAVVLADSPIGVRPNSPPQTTSVSSSRPRRFRSVIRAAHGWSISLADVVEVVVEVCAAAAVVVPVVVVELHEPHAALDQPAGQQAVVGERRLARLGAVQVERLLRSRCARSISSGALVCIRKAISYEAIRVAISGSPVASSRSWFRSLTASSESPLRGRRRRPAGWTGSGSGRRRCGTARPGRRSAGSRCPSCASPPRGPLRPGLQHDEAGQVLRLAAEAVGHPRRPCSAGRTAASRCS